MDLKPTFEHYYPEGTVGPGIGNLKGQCAVFAEALVSIGTVGNTIATKKAAVKDRGITAEKLKENFQAGDVVVLDVGTKEGHIAVVNLPGNNLRLSESNWNLDLRVHHTRTIPKSSPQIVGVLRGPLKVQVINPPLQTTFMKLTVINNSTIDLSQKLADLSEWFKTYSSGRLEVVIDVRQTHFTNIPFQNFQSSKAVNIDWYRSNVTPLASGQVSLFFVNFEEWKSGGWGMMSYGDPGKPVRCETTFSPQDETFFVDRAFHEICHALFFLTGQQDLKPDGTYIVHDYLYQNPPRYKELLDLIDYQALQNKLVTIKGEPMNQAKVVKSKTSPKVYVCYEMPDMDYLNKKANIEGF